MLLTHYKTNGYNLMAIISVSVSESIRSVLGAEAKRQRRSRSFIVAEAVRAYVATRVDHAFAHARSQTLRDGLALSPQGRIDLAEDLWQEFARGHTPAQPWARTFDTFADYDRWRREGGEKSP